MEASPEPVDIRRVLVILRASSPCHDLAEVSTRLAGMLQTEVLGLFLKDDRAVGGTAVPFSHEVRRLPATLADTDPKDAERLFRAQIRRIDRLFAERAAPRGIRSRIEVVPGSHIGDLQRALRPGDLIALDEPKPTVPPSRLLMESLVELGSHMVALVRSEQTLPRPIVVLFEPTPAGEQALNIAIHLALQFGLGTLSTILLTTEEDGAESTEEYRTRISEIYGLNVSMHQLSAFDVVKLARVVQKEGNGLVVVPGSIVRNSLQPILGSLRALPWSFIVTS